MNTNSTPLDDRQSGISRREMIKGTVVAGGLVWAAPVLLSGKAAAQVDPAPCCEDGQAITISFDLDTEVLVPGTGGGTILAGAGVAFDAPTQELLDCLQTPPGPGLTVTVDTSGQGRVDIVLTGITLIAIAVDRNNDDIQICPDFTTTGNLRVEVAGDTTTIEVTGLGGVDGPIELSICLPDLLSPFCP